MFGTLAASKMFLAGMLFVYCCGCHALRATRPGHWNWLAIPCFFTFYSSGFLWGFVNYVAGVAVFLLAFAWWYAGLERPGGARWAVTAILALLSYLCHLTAYGFLCVAAGVVVLLRLRRRALNLRRAAGALAPLAPPLFVYQYLRLMGGRNDALHLGWNSPLEKIPALLNLVRTYDTSVDAALLVGAPVAAAGKNPRGIRGGSRGFLRVVSDRTARIVREFGLGRRRAVRRACRPVAAAGP
jgi:hypothetical protein